jgi:hypothetical protein
MLLQILAVVAVAAPVLVEMVVIGGSGIVILRYPGSIQYFTGGTVTYAAGYVVHTFTSSGTLAPTTPTNLLGANTIVFFSSNTWTAPAGATQVQYLVVGWWWRWRWRRCYGLVVVVLVDSVLLQACL